MLYARTAYELSKLGPTHPAHTERKNLGRIGRSVTCKYGYLRITPLGTSILRTLVIGTTYTFRGWLQDFSNDTGYTCLSELVSVETELLRFIMECDMTHTRLCRRFRVLIRESRLRCHKISHLRLLAKILDKETATYCSYIMTARRSLKFWTIILPTPKLRL